MNLIKTHSLLDIELHDVRIAIKDAIGHCNRAIATYKKFPESESLITLMNNKKTNLEVALTKLNY